MKYTALFFLLTSVTLFSQEPILLSDFNSGESDAFTRFTGHLTSNKQIYVNVVTEAAGEELGIISNGELSLLKDINPGPESSRPVFFTKAFGKVFFIASDEVSGGELWSTDGTEEGTQIEFDPENTRTPRGLTLTESGNLYFTVDDVLYRFNGTDTEEVFTGVNFTTKYEEEQGANFTSYRSDVAFVINTRQDFELYVVNDLEVTLIAQIPVASSFDDAVNLQPLNNGLIFSNDAFSFSNQATYLIDTDSFSIDSLSINSKYLSRIRSFDGTKVFSSVRGEGYYLSNGVQGEETLIFESTEPVPASGFRTIFGVYEDKFIAEVSESFFGDKFMIYYNGETSEKILESTGYSSNVLIKGNFAFFADGTSNGFSPTIYSVDMTDGSIQTLKVFEERSLNTNSIIIVGVVDDQLFYASNLDGTIGRELYTLTLEETVSNENVIDEDNYKMETTPSSFRLNAKNYETFDARLFGIDGRLLQTIKATTNETYHFNFSEGIILLNIQVGNAINTYKIAHFNE